MQINIKKFYTNTVNLCMYLPKTFYISLPSVYKVHEAFAINTSLYLHGNLAEPLFIEFSSCYIWRQKIPQHKGVGAHLIGVYKL